MKKEEKLLLLILSSLNALTSSMTMSVNAFNQTVLKNYISSDNFLQRAVSCIPGCITSIKVDSNNDIFIGTDKGCFEIEEGSAEAKPITDIKGTITCIETDYNNNVYVGTNNGCFKIEGGTKKLKVLKK